MAGSTQRSTGSGQQKLLLHLQLLLLSLHPQVIPRCTADSPARNPHPQRGPQVDLAKLLTLCLSACSTTRPNTVPGVTCQGDMAVGLNLSGVAVRGPVPASISSLKGLSLLDLSNCALHGSLPSEIGLLTNLRTLDLSANNEIRGSIPNSFFSLPNLRTLMLRRLRRLEGSIPNEISQLQDLTQLAVESTSISGTIPSAIGALSNLQILDLSNNQLSGALPPQLFSLQTLVHMQVNGNSLWGHLPSTLALASQLTHLDASSNFLTGTVPLLPSKKTVIPSIVFNSPATRSVNLSYNYFSALPLQLHCSTPDFSFEGNCFSPRPPPPCHITNRQLADCQAFCGLGHLATQQGSLHVTDAPCGGLGTCVPSSMNNASKADASSAPVPAFHCAECAQGTLPSSWASPPNQTCSTLPPPLATPPSPPLPLSTVPEEGAQGPAPSPATGTMIAVGVGAAVLLGIGVVLVTCWCFRFSKTLCNPLVPPFLPEFKGLRNFTFQELLDATDTFSEDNTLPRGHCFGVLSESDPIWPACKVMVKRVPISLTALSGPLNHTKVLSGCRHPNLATLVGYAFEADELLLVFDHVSRVTLEDLLEADILHPMPQNPQRPPLTWERRMKIAVGIARGLRFLHKGQENGKITVHGCLRSDAVFVDEDSNPRLVDYGLQGEEEVEQHTGYEDPLGGPYPTTESDVFAMGVLLLELVTGLRPLGISNGDGKQQMHLVHYVAAEFNHPQGVTQLAAPALQQGFHGRGKGVMAGPWKLTEESFRRVLLVGLWCCILEPELRPNTDQVVAAIERIVEGKDEGEEVAVLTDSGCVDEELFSMDMPQC